MNLGYYVYYKVPQDRAAEVRDIVERVIRDIHAETGIAGRLLRRRDDPSTWMEVYENVADAQSFERTLASVLARHGFDRALPAGTKRVTEVFQPF